MSSQFTVNQLNVFQQAMNSLNFDASLVSSSLQGFEVSISYNGNAFQDLGSSLNNFDNIITFKAGEDIV